MPHRSLGTYFSCSFRFPNIGRAELAAIEQILRHDIRPDSYHIACQGHVYESVEEIPSHPGVIRTLVLYTSSPYLRIKFARSWAELSCEEAAKAPPAALQRIREIIASHERRLLGTLCRYSVWSVPLIAFGVLTEGVLLVNAGYLPFWALYAAVGIALACYGWWAFVYLSVTSRYCRITL